MHFIFYLVQAYVLSTAKGLQPIDIIICFHAGPGNLSHYNDSLLLVNEIGANGIRTDVFWGIVGELCIYVY